MGFTYLRDFKKTNYVDLGIKIIYEGKAACD